ncbi:hypothetical protein EDC96DRAFT_546432 [Choanephora cucurbitarum]|nr:hypothetical protein EDC96DRAFT_546432 [Choanephora cucurbitarum]
MTLVSTSLIEGVKFNFNPDRCIECNIQFRSSNTAITDSGFFGSTTVSLVSISLEYASILYFDQCQCCCRNKESCVSASLCTVIPRFREQSWFPRHRSLNQNRSLFLIAIAGIFSVKRTSVPSRPFPKSKLFLIFRSLNRGMAVAVKENPYFKAQNFPLYRYKIVISNLLRLQFVVQIPSRLNDHPLKVYSLFQTLPLIGYYDLAWLHIHLCFNKTKLLQSGSGDHRLLRSNL